MNVGTGTTCKPLSAWVEAPFSKAGWGSSLKGARWAGSLGPQELPVAVGAVMAGVLVSHREHRAGEVGTVLGPADSGPQ